jgi:CheY-like chemotaxis protein
MTRSISFTVPVRVLIVDDQSLFREAAQALVDATLGFECIGRAASGEEGVELTERLRPDLVLMDVRMPGIGGIQAARKIASRDDGAVVVLVTAEDPLADPPPGVATEIVAKRALSQALLRRLWEEHESASPATPSFGESERPT